MKKTKLIFTALFALSILAVLAFSGCSEPDKEYTVMYEISGPAIIANQVSYRNETGGSETINNVNIPWSKTIIIKNKQFTNAFASVSCSAVFPTSHNGNTYTAKIYVNGTEKTSSSSSVGAVTITYVIP